MHRNNDAMLDKYPYDTTMPTVLIYEVEYIPFEESTTLVTAVQMMTDDS